MAGTVTITEITYTSARKVTFAWIAHTTGAADGTTSASFDGEIVGLITIPSISAQPDDDYDVAVNDSDGHDVLLGAGADRDETNTEYVTGASLAAVAGSKLTLAVTAAGSTREGTVILFIR